MNAEVTRKTRMGWRHAILMAGAALALSGCYYYPAPPAAAVPAPGYAYAPYGDYYGGYYAAPGYYYPAPAYGAVGVGVGWGGGGWGGGYGHWR